MKLNYLINSKYRSLKKKKLLLYEGWVLTNPIQNLKTNVPK